MAVETAISKLFIYLYVLYDGLIFWVADNCTTVGKPFQFIVLNVFI